MSILSNGRAGSNRFVGGYISPPCPTRPAPAARCNLRAPVRDSARMTTDPPTKPRLDVGLNLKGVAPSGLSLIHI